MNRSVLYSFLGHLAILGLLSALSFTRGVTPEGARVYSVSIVPGVVGGTGQPGSGGKAEVGVTGMVGKPGKIGGTALPKAKSAKGTALVEEARKPKKPTTAKPDTTSGAGPDQIALRVYGTGGTIGGGGIAGTGGGGGDSGRPATAYEVAMNGKITANWNEDLWKAMPERLACTVQFLIHADGTVSDITVFEPSSNESFNSAAQRAIELARMPAPVDYGITGKAHQARVTFVNRPD